MLKSFFKEYTLKLLKYGNFLAIRISCNKEGKSKCLSVPKFKLQSYCVNDLCIMTFTEYQITGLRSCRISIFRALILHNDYKYHIVNRMQDLLLGAIFCMNSKAPLVCEEKEGLMLKHFIEFKLFLKFHQS